ncbi:cytoskeletal protein RodZ [Pullulanibacillus pueri]|uniref:XRE family transcriptional regulator n=1 Tax=Pullulanibacillus pueri TaxID=1437324 RepID=A0A8J3EMB2_9BACL|nr:helix-turn-helix domain-containing protein [Pullulanibacillus pueri]MBM7682542.1 cytoskeletal protein RodZ [Pullulanibacillus pueri]GGH81989.1 XRE family transcriptional regulator [Pullulanibacillus pueri]
MSELGQVLKEAREAKGLSLDEIQETTKIQKRYLAAIERGDYQILPGQFYIRAFIKSYAEALGLDTQEIFSQYGKEIPQPVQPEIEQLPSRSVKTTPIKAKNTSSKVSSILPFAGAVVILLALGIGIWVVAQHMSGGSDSSKDTETSNDDVTLEQGNDIGNHQSKSNDAVNDQPGSEASAKDTDTDKENKTTSDETEQKQTQKLSEPETNGSASTYTLSGTDKFVVEVTAMDGHYSWLTATKDNASGEKYFYDSVSKGVDNRKDVSFKKDLSDIGTLYLKIGDTHHAIVKINGEVLKYPNDDYTQSITINFKKS